MQDDRERLTPENRPPVPSSFRGTTHLSGEAIVDLTPSDEALETEVLQRLEDAAKPLPMSLQLATIDWMDTILKNKSQQRQISSDNLHQTKNPPKSATLEFKLNASEGLT